MKVFSKSAEHMKNKKYDYLRFSFIFKISYVKTRFNFFKSNFLIMLIFCHVFYVPKYYTKRYANSILCVSEKDAFERLLQYYFVFKCYENLTFK